MYVDGANHRPLVDEVQVSQRYRDSKVSVVAGDEPKPDSLYLPEMSHPAHILQDSFERMQEARAARATYGETDEPVRHYEKLAVAGVLDELRGTLGEGYHDDIAQLASDIESKGLPLISDRYDGGVVYRSFIEAYDRVSVNHAGSPVPETHDLLDTAG